MGKDHIPGTWEVKLDGGTWQVLDEGGQLIATIGDIPDAKAKAKVAVSPFMMEALKAFVFSSNTKTGYAEIYNIEKALKKESQSIASTMPQAISPLES